MFQTKKLVIATAAALGGALSMGVSAQEATYSPADANRDGHVSAQEWSNYNAALPTPAEIAERQLAEQEARPPSEARDEARDTPSAIQSDTPSAIQSDTPSAIQSDTRDDVQRGDAEDPQRQSGEVSYWRADANRDGIVTDEEWEQYRLELEQQMSGTSAPGTAPGPAAGVAPNEAGEATYWNADTNKDGTVSAEEWRAYRDQIAPPR